MFEMSWQSLKGISVNQLRALRRLEESFRVSFENHLRKQYKYRAVALAVAVSTLHILRRMLRSKDGRYELMRSSLGKRCLRTLWFGLCFYFFTNPVYRQKLFCATIYLDRLNFSLFDFNLHFCRNTRRLEFID